LPPFHPPTNSLRCRMYSTWPLWADIASFRGASAFPVSELPVIIAQPLLPPRHHLGISFLRRGPVRPIPRSSTHPSSVDLFSRDLPRRSTPSPISRTPFLAEYVFLFKPTTSPRTLFPPLMRCLFCCVTNTWAAFFFFKSRHSSPWQNRYVPIFFYPVFFLSGGYPGTRLQKVVNRLALQLARPVLGACRLHSLFVPPWQRPHPPHSLYPLPLNCKLRTRPVGCVVVV